MISEDRNTRVLVAKDASLYSLSQNDDKCVQVVSLKFIYQELTSKHNFHELFQTKSYLEYMVLQFSDLCVLIFMFFQIIIIKFCCSNRILLNLISFIVPEFQKSN